MAIGGGGGQDRDEGHFHKITYSARGISFTLDFSSARTFLHSRDKEKEIYIINLYGIIQ